MSKFANATYALMKRLALRVISSDDLWAALQQVDPDLTCKSEVRKTPRTTMMRDLRKDDRFVVVNRRISLSE